MCNNTYHSDKYRRRAAGRAEDLGGEHRAAGGSGQCGQFSEFHVCFCGLDSGDLKFETVRTNKQHICF